MIRLNSPFFKTLFLFLFGIAGFQFAAAQDDVQPHAGMMRYPDVSETHIAFVYARDIWVVPKEGGVAVPLASPRGEERFPSFSPDGQTIAFVGNYDGNNDIYTVSTQGGIPQRLTHHPSSERLCGWTKDGRLIFAMSGLAGLGRQTQLFTVREEGGMPEKLPVPYGGFGTISEDGQWLAYTPYNRDFRTWKRYRGGNASDIWLFHLTEYTSKKITDWEGTDTIPMWQGKTVYYLSDAGSNHRLNIWSYNTETEQRRQITDFEEYDVKWPSSGPGSNGEGEIVFQCGPDLYLLNLATNETRIVKITVPGARPTLRSQLKNVNNLISNWNISPTGKRVLVSARGDIWSLPAKKGSPRNLTQTSGTAERFPAWSPDGKWIAYFSDASGEYELYLRSTKGYDQAKKITSLGKGYKFQPLWSPDSKMLVFQDSEDQFYIHFVEKEETRLVDKNLMLGGIPSFRFSWSHDSNWLAYTKRVDSVVSSIWLYNVIDDSKHQVTSGMFNDSEPTFDKKGEFLFFASHREFASPQYDDMGFNFVYRDSAVLHGVPLRSDIANPFSIQSDEEVWKEKKENEENKDDQDDDNGKDEDHDKDQEHKKSQEEHRDKEKKMEDDEPTENTSTGDNHGHDEVTEKETTEDNEEQKEEEKEVLQIDLEGFEHRAFRLPVPRGRFSNLMVNEKNQLIYRRGNSLKLFDLKEDKKEEKTVLDDVNMAVLSADGKKLLVRSGGETGIIDAAPKQKIEDQVPTSPMKSNIAPREEWRQLYTDAWRIMRDFFFDPHMHGVDWDAVRKQYEAMLDDCVSREDVGYIIGEMIAELNSSHTYYGGGDIERGPSESYGFLGVDYALDQGLYKVAKVYEGGAWDTDARNPISDLNSKQREQFHYLFAVNGVPIDTKKDPWAAFESLSGQVVTLTVSATPAIETATDVVIKLISSGRDRELRFRSWIETNRSYVEKKSEGKVGYIYVVNTSINGQNDLYRQFYGQMTKEALIIDERWNGGGQMPDRFVQLLNRPVSLHLFKRHEKNWRVPEVSHQGPKCMLINGPAGSGGDLFPFLFKEAKVGKLIGMRTWGGVIGISGNPRLIDGASLTAPNITMYENDGTLTIEGYGVEPDIEVIDDPALMVDGGDPQLDAAIRHMLEEIETHPYAPPARPPYPDRSGMGIKEEYK